MMNLNNANLNALAPELKAPTYDRGQRRSGITHVGVGHFHRSHQAMYVDRPEAGTVPGSHVLVKALDCISTGKITEFLVHVVGSGARVITDPDAEILDFERLLFRNL